MSETGIPSALAHLNFSNLPEGWAWTPLAPLIEKIEAGKSFQCEERPPAPDEYGVLKVSAVTWGTYNEAESKTVIDPKRINPAYLVQAGDFLFSRANTIQLVGACVIAGSTTRRLMLSDKILRLVFSSDVRNWVLWFLRSSLGRKQIEALSTGNQESMRNIGQRRIAEIKIPLPPPTVRSSIQSKIDELFSRIDEGDAALARVEKLVERYRQSVLKAAVTGELTRDWREARRRAGEPVESGAALLARILKARRAAWEAAELKKMEAKGKPPTNERWKQKYKEPEPPDTADLPELPEDWVWASMDQVGLVSGGLTKNQRRRTLTAQRPYLRVANVYANRLDLDDVQQIGVDEGELDRVLLEKGDLLVVEGNGSIDQIGRVAVWDGSIAGCVHQNHLIKVRCTKLLPSWYALIWCLSPLGREHIRRVASSTAGLHTLSISKVASLPVPVPTSGELDLIRDRFDQAVALVANERQSLRQSRTTSTALRQSILKAAFSGQLVPQDPHDEPASKLLERIAAERAAAPALCNRKKKSA